jgi:hypothetical protein
VRQTDSCSDYDCFERTQALSDAVTLIAGILLVSVGLLALLGLALLRVRPGLAGNPAEGDAAATPALDTTAPQDGQPAEAPGPGMEELLAQLFSLRMTVSEVAAEVQEARDVLEEDAAEVVAPILAEPAEEAA